MKRLVARDLETEKRTSMTVTISNVRTILTMPDQDNRLVIVKVETSEAGLYGLGCATFTQRPQAVRSAVDDYLRPFLQGKDVQRIEDIWQTIWVNAYWRNGPVLNNALSGIDMALWDIKGKLANMSVYQLLGGKCREGAAVYRHADGRDAEEVADRAQSLIEQGYRHIRCQLGGYGGESQLSAVPNHNWPGNYFDPAGYARSVPHLFARLREQLGDEVELMHDVHERLAPAQVITLARELEPFHLFFLEDPLPPEQSGWLERLRQQSAIPLAMGELFNNPQEWATLITGRLLDFIRVHLSQIGGLTPALKLAHLCEAFGVRTAWHGPRDTSPVGHAANLHLDLACHNFGIQEWSGWSEATAEVFPGCPQVHNGYLYSTNLPGLGIDLNEAQAARYPCTDGPPTWTLVRTPDGAAARP
jgi:mannonate dehydratase